MVTYIMDEHSVLFDSIEVLGEKICPIACLSTLAWEWTQASALWSQWLTALAVARPEVHRASIFWV